MALTWATVGLLAAAWTVILTGHPGAGQLLLAAALVTGLGPAIPRQRAVVRFWLDGVPSYKPARPAEELHCDPPRTDRI